MNIREWKLKTIAAGICVLSICIPLIYSMKTQAVEDTGVQVENTDVQIVEDENDNISPEMDPKLEEEISEEQKAEEMLTEEQEADESVSGDRSAEETIPEMQRSENGSQETPKSVQWNYIEEYDLKLQYDDRYSFTTVKAGWKIVSIKTKEVLSNRVSGGKDTGERDTDVILSDEQSDTDIVAAGVGEAEILLVPEDKWELAQAVLEDPAKVSNSDEIIDAIKINVTVEPAKLTLMYVAGQSNAEGYCSSNSGYRLSDSIACPEGEVYSTYAPFNSNGNVISGTSFTKFCTQGNASQFVAGAIRDNKSISGNELEYELNSLSGSGSGKTGPDSGLAYEWNRLTGDKVWVVNTARGGSSISSWLPGQIYYERSMEVNSLVKQTYEAEIEAGHYLSGKRLLFWLQGEADKSKTAKAYYNSFETLYYAAIQELDLDAFGVIMVRSNEGSKINAEDISMSGPRIAQYAAGNSKELSKLFVVSNANEQWVSDDKVKSYFTKAYPEGYLTYPTHGTSHKLPTSVSEIHGDIHYSQVAHNENGITAADGMYAVLYHSQEENPKVYWNNREGTKITGLTLGLGDVKVAVPVAEPVYCSKQMECEVNGTAVSYDKISGTLNGKKEGTAKISARSAGGNIVSTLAVTVKGIGVPKLKGTTTSKSGIKVSWDPVGSVTGYAVYRKTSGGNWSMIDTTTSTSYTDTRGMKNGTVYYYTVRAYKGNINTAKNNKYDTKYWSGYDSSGVKGRYIAVPAISQATASAGGTTISWKAVSKATGYVIYRKEGGGSWASIATTTSTSYTDKTSLKNGKIYYYTVRAYTGNLTTAQDHKYESNYWSHYNEAGVKSVYIDTPELTGTATAKNGIKISWKTVKGVSGYAIYRRTSSTGWKMITTTTAASYVDTAGMKNKTAYYYTVRAYSGNITTANKNRYDAKYWSGYDNTGAVGKYYSTPVLSGAKASSEGTTVSWKKVSGAAGYAVYRKAAGGKWATIATTTSSSYTDKATLTNGKTYYYTVRAYAGNLRVAQAHKYDCNYWSHYSTIGLKSIYLNAPDLTETTIVNSGIKVSWKKIDGASGYAVYRKTASTDWKMIATTTSVSYTDKDGMKNGSVYFYTVRAYEGNVTTAKKNKYDAQCWGEYDNNGIKGRYMSTPVLLNEKSLAESRTIEWKPVKGATGYAVYRKIAGGSWNMIDTTKAVTYEDTDLLMNGQIYYYTIRAYAGNVDTAKSHKYDSNYWSYYNTTGLKSRYIVTPKLKEAVQTDSGTKITWETVNGVIGYAVYQKKPGERWSMLDTTYSNCYTNRGNGSIMCFYTVRAYWGDEAAAQANKYSSVYWSGYESIGITSEKCEYQKY